jgi:ABC-type nitrate/sulfonate/bicarbonate transport system substrate-binding protein
LLKFFATGGEKKDGDVIYGMVVRSDAPINALLDLKGKKIGVTDPLTTLNLKLILKSVGLDPAKDVSISQVDRTVGVAALISKQVDAFILSEPDLTTSMEKGGLKAIDTNMRAKYIMDPYWSGAAATTASFAQKNPVAMKRLFKALDKAIDLIRSNPADARALFPKYTALSDQASQKVGLYFFAKTTEVVDMKAIQTLAD